MDQNRIVKPRTSRENKIHKTLFWSKKDPPERVVSTYWYSENSDCSNDFEFRLKIIIQESITLSESNYSFPFTFWVDFVLSTTVQLL